MAGKASGFGVLMVGEACEPEGKVGGDTDSGCR
jgi:hypothetical protein